MISDVSQGGDELEFEELVTLMGRKNGEIRAQEARRREEMAQAFRDLDASGCGFISAAEFRHVLTNLDEKLSDVEMELFIHLAHVDGGEVNYEAFLKLAP
eukprot:TRINITY_DN4000_c0_g1_i5.p2 TRINITY_DN4000_c0_g1~~TRINITY_DN4000_c0_g1_i5.p2  ORF type:complete len:100 (+),score=38.48 TRINITY_DN4000_c0_g1_i5:215-514(+)